MNRLKGLLVNRVRELDHADLAIILICVGLGWRYHWTVAIIAYGTIVLTLTVLNKVLTHGEK